MSKPVLWFLIFSLSLPGVSVSQEVKTEIADGAILEDWIKSVGRYKTFHFIPEILLFLEPYQYY